MTCFNSFGSRQSSFGRSLYPMQPFGSVIFPDKLAIDFINAAGITDATQQQAITKLVYDLVINRLWDKMTAIYPFVGGTASTHKWNLKNPQDTDAAFRLSFIGGVTHASTGVTFNGTTGYADTFLTPLSVLANDNNSLAYYSRTSAASSGQFAIDIGAVPNQNVDPSLYCLIIRRPTSNVSAFSANTSSSGVGANTTTTNGSGLFTGSITSSSSRKLYRNGNSIATNTTNASQSLPSQKIFIGAISNNNVASLFSGVRECAFVSIGDGLSDTESANLYTTVQDFQTTLGRQV